MEEIAAGAGLFPEELAGYYQNTQDVLYGMTADFFMHLHMVIHTALLEDPPPHPGEVVARCVAAIANLEHAAIRLRVAMQVWGEGMRDPQLRELFGERIDAILTLATTLGDQAQRAGYVDANVPPETAARTFMSVVAGFILFGSIDDNLDYGAYEAAIRTLLTGGINAATG